MGGFTPPQEQEAPTGNMADDFWNAAGMPNPNPSGSTPSAPVQQQQPQIQQPFNVGGSGNQKIMNAFNPMAGMQQQIQTLQQQQQPAPPPQQQGGMADDFWEAANKQPNMNSQQPAGGKQSGGK